MYHFHNYMQQDSKYKLFCTHYVLFDFCMHINIYHYSTFVSSYMFYHQTCIYTCFVNIFDLFIPIVILKYSSLKSSVSFETHTLLDKSSRVLQLPTHLSKLTANGY